MLWPTMFDTPGPFYFEQAVFAPQKGSFYMMRVQYSDVTNTNNDVYLCRPRAHADPWPRIWGRGAVKFAVNRKFFLLFIKLTVNNDA